MAVSRQSLVKNEDLFCFGSGGSCVLEAYFSSIMMCTQVPIKTRPFGYKDTLMHWLIFVLPYSSWDSCNYSQCWLTRVSEPPFTWATLASSAFEKSVW